MLRNTLAKARSLKAAALYRAARWIYVDPETGLARTAVGAAPKASHRRVDPPPSALQRIGGFAQRFVSGLVHGVMDVVGLFIDWTAGLGPKKGMRSDVAIVGHRGSPARMVENTIESFEEAVVVDGADVVETDICLTKDGEVVLWHDWSPDSLVSFIRQQGGEAEMAHRPLVPPAGSPLRKPVSQLTHAEFVASHGYATVVRGNPVDVRIPTIADLFRWAKGRPELRGIVLDVKVPPEQTELVPRLVDRVVAAWKEAALPGVALYWLTPQSRVLRAIQAHAKDVVVSLDVEIPGGVVVDFDKYSAVLRAQAYGSSFASVGRPQVTVGGWSVYRSIVSSDVGRIAQLRDAGKDVPRLFCWTINRKSEMKDLVRYGVDGILTDYPQRLRSLMGKPAR